MPRQTHRWYTGVLGNILNIKPILELRNDAIEPADKVRTKQKAIQRVVEMAVECIHGRTQVRLAVTHVTAEAEAVLKATRLN